MQLDFVITVDRTLMSDHHGKEFIGFMTTSPAVGLPEWLWMWIAAPKPRVDEYGRPYAAPYGLRKVEAALQNAGFKAAVIDPDHIHRYLKHAKALMIGHHDFFAFCAPSNVWWAVTKREPVNRKYFMKLMDSKPVREFKQRGGKLIMGGPAAWQWLHVEDLWERWGVDTVIDGEAEKVIVDIAQKILDGEPLPKYIYVAPHEVPRIEEIPLIRAPSVNGLVEIMRGCPRGCKFCSVTLRPLRYIPIEMIVKEIRINKRGGVTHALLHSEDVLLYGANGVIPREEPLMKLHQAVAKEGVTLGWSHVSLAAVVAAQRNGRIVTKLMDFIKSAFEQDYIGVQTGIETGSPRLAKIIMPGKAAPYSPEQWPEIVEEAFAIMAENDIIPAATIILNLPEETIDDIVKTMELLDRLKPYPSLVVPMYFVPMGVLKDKRALLNFRIKPEHIEIMWKCLEHSLYWAPKLAKKYLCDNPLVLLGIRLFIAFVRWKKRSLEPKVRELIEEARRGIYEHRAVKN